MEIYTGKSKLEGFVAIPASKSHTIRAVAIASLAKGESIIKNPLVSNDTISAVECYRRLGAEIDNRNEKEWIIDGNGGKISFQEDKIDVGNSGTTLRIALGSSALVSGKQSIVFDGDEQIRTRSVAHLLNSLNELGAECKSFDGSGKVPVEVKGTLKGGKTTIECWTSQYLTSLLMCLPLAEKNSEIDITLLNEPDYVQITLDWLDRQGIEYQNKNLKKFKIKGGQKYFRFQKQIPADFSSATFFLVGAALFGGRVEIMGLDFKDSQPDKLVIDYLEQMGADIQKTENSIIVTGGNRLKGAELDLNRTPDALPAMAIAGLFAEGNTRIYNVSQARKKETDRIRCMAEELKKLGAEVEEMEDGLKIQGGQELEAAELDGRKDHRIVMALSLAGMGIDGTSKITSAEAISVTFPNYVELMHSIGAKMKIQM